MGLLLKAVRYYCPLEKIHRRQARSIHQRRSIINQKLPLSGGSAEKSCGARARWHYNVGAPSPFVSRLALLRESCAARAARRSVRAKKMKALVVDDNELVRSNVAEVLRGEG